MEIGRVLAPQPLKGETQMLKMIAAAVLVMVITSSSALAGIMLTHAAFARNSAINAGVLLDESQSFRLAAKAAVDLRLVSFDGSRPPSPNSFPRVTSTAAAMPPLFCATHRASIAPDDGLQPKKS